MSLLKRRPEDNDPAPGNAAPGHQQSGIIKRGAINHTAAPDEPAPPPQEPGQIRVVGDPTAAPPRHASAGASNPMTTSGGPPGPSAAARSQAAANMAAEKDIIDRAEAKAAAIIQDGFEKIQQKQKAVEQELLQSTEAHNLRCQQEFEQAYQDGFARGQADGMGAARQEFLGVMQEAQSVLAQAMQGREALFKAATGEIAKMALRVAERVIGHEVNVNEDVVIGTIKLALEKVKARESVTVRCNPSDVEYVKMNRDIFERMVEGLKTFAVEPDGKVERGGCILQTNLGNVDARIQTQLAVLHQAFADAERMPDDAPTPENLGTLDFRRYYKAIDAATLIKMHGRVTQVIGLTIESEGPACQIAELCYVETPHGEVPAEVVGFKNSRVLLMPLGEMRGIGPGCEVRGTGGPLCVKVGWGLLGRVLNGLGEPMDGKGPIEVEAEYPVHNDPPDPFKRPRITQVLSTGVRVLDMTLTLGRGQRVGIFAGSGVGKSTIFGMIARYTVADVNVLTLIGERNRELRDFLEGDLGAEGAKKSVIIVATSDQPALVRRMGAYVGTACAEFFRDQGKDVFLMMDSATRFAMAQREVGLAIGEPPATKGYTPSVFALFPKLLERPGTRFPNGSITAIYTVLVEGDDMNEIIADTVRGILDGHIVLTRKIAHQNRYPAVDVLQSVSRLFTEITSREHQDAAGKLRKVLDTYAKNEDLIKIGAYKDGSDADVDYAKKMIKDVFAFLSQRKAEPSTFEESMNALTQLMSRG